MPFCNLSAGDHVQDLFCERDDDATGQGEEAIGTLARIMAGKRETDLDDAPTQQDQAHRANQSEDKLGQIVDDGDGIGVRIGGEAESHDEGDSQKTGTVDPEGLHDFGRHGELIGVLVIEIVHFVFPPVIYNSFQDPPQREDQLAALLL